MSEMKNVIAGVISQKGTCSAGHKVGDEFIIGQHAPSGMCAWAFFTVFPFATPLQTGASFPWEPNEGKAVVACPDSGNPVVFELRRV